MKKDLNLFLIELFIFFVFGCLFGTFFEEILNFIKSGYYERRAGVLYGPFNPLYGLGVILFLIIFEKKNRERSVIKTFLLTSILGGILEYSVSLIVEIFFKIRFWDYSTLFLNINGRTTILFMGAWGLMATILLKIIYPFFKKIIKDIPIIILRGVCLFMFIFLIADITLTFGAFLRMKNRVVGVQAQNVIEFFYDDVYPDYFMYKKFPLLKGKF